MPTETVEAGSETREAPPEARGERLNGSAPRPAAPRQRAAAAAAAAEPKPEMRHRWLLLAGNIFMWIVTPAVWLLAVGFVGPQLNEALSLYLTAALFVVLFLGLPLTMIVEARLLFRLEARLGGDPQRRLRVRVRASELRRARAPLPPPKRIERPPLSPRRRVLAATVIGVMLAGSVVLWTVVPIGWIWFASQLVDTTQPVLWPYLLIIVAVPITMIIGSRLLFGLQLYYCRLVGIPEPSVGRAAWLKSLRDDRADTRPAMAIDGVMSVSVAVAILALICWFAFFADLSGLLPPELQNMSP